MIVDNTFKTGWTNRLNDGTVSVGDGYFNVNTTQGGYNDYYFSVTQGDVITVEFEYKVVSGEGYFAVNSTIDNFVNFVDDGYYLKETSWTPIKFTYTVPMDKNYNLGRLALGVKGGTSGNINFRNVKINVDSLIPKIDVFGYGLIAKPVDGSPQLSVSRNSFNISKITLEDGYTIRVTLKTKFNINNRPIVLVTGNSEVELVPLVSNFSADTNSFDIKFTDGTAFRNITSRNLFINLLVI